MHLQSIIMDVQRNPVDDSNPVVFMDISIGEEVVGRMIIELRADVVPKTAENFRRLCDGSAGIGSFCNRSMTYEGTSFYKVQRTFAVQGGDVANNSGHSGDSIYGQYFDDENFTLSNTTGAVGMSNFGRPNTNNSQFYITSVDAINLDGTSVVVGYVIRGLGILAEMEKFAGDEHIDDYKPTREIKIHKCGQIHPGQPWNLGDQDDPIDNLPPFPLDWLDRPAEIPFPQMISSLNRIKAAAKISFQQKDFINAGRRYKKAQRYFNLFMSELISKDKDMIAQLEAINRMNSESLSLVEIKLNHWHDALALCDQVLKYEQNNCRAMFRRGKANIELQNYDDGLRDIKAAKMLSPRDPQIETELQNAQRLWKSYIAKQRLKYQKMFK